MSELWLWLKSRLSGIFVMGKAGRNDGPSQIKERPAAPEKKIIRIAGVNYTAEAVEELRKEMIVLRDQALDAESMSWAVKLSRVISYMAVTKDLLWAGEGEDG